MASISQALQALLSREALALERLSRAEDCEVVISDKSWAQAREFFDVQARLCAEFVDPWTAYHRMDPTLSDEIQAVLPEIEDVLLEAERMLGMKVKSLALHHELQHIRSSTDAQRYVAAESNAVREIDSISKRDICEVRAFAKPPAGVNEIIETWAFLLNDGKTLIQLFPHERNEHKRCRLFLHDVQLLRKSVEFRSSSSSQETIREIKHRMTQIWFDYDWQRLRCTLTSRVIRWIQFQMELYELTSEPAIISLTALDEERKRLASIFRDGNAWRDFTHVRRKLETTCAFQSGDVPTVVSEAIDILSVAHSCPSDFNGQHTFRRRALVQAMPSQVTVELNWITGEKHEFRIGMESKVQDAKEAILEQICVPAICQKWMLNDVAMPNMAVLVDFFEHAKENPRLEIMLVVELEACYEKLTCHDSGSRKAGASALVQMARDEVESSVGALLLAGWPRTTVLDRHIVKLLREDQDVKLDSIQCDVQRSMPELHDVPAYLVALVKLIDLLRPRCCEGDRIASELLEAILKGTNDAEVGRHVLEAKSRIGDGQIIDLLVNRVQAHGARDLLPLLISVLASTVSGEANVQIKLAATQRLETAHVETLLRVLKDDMWCFSASYWNNLADLLLQSGLVDTAAFLDICVHCAGEHFTPAIERLPGLLCEEHTTVCERLLEIVAEPIEVGCEGPRIKQVDCRLKVLQTVTNVSNTGPSAMVQFLCTCMDDPNVEIRLAALNALPSLANVLSHHTDIKRAVELMANADWPHVRSHAACMHKTLFSE